MLDLSASFLEDMTVCQNTDQCYLLLWLQFCNHLGPVPEKPINANLRLKINHFSTPTCCSTQIFGRTLHEKTSILKTKISKRNFHQKVENVKQRFTLILD